MNKFKHLFDIPLAKYEALEEYPPPDEVKRALEAHLVNNKETPKKPTVGSQLRHICFDKRLFQTLEDFEVPIQAGTSTTMSQGRGRVDLDVDGYTLSLHGVLYAPQLRFNMLSTECLRRENFFGYNSIPNVLYNGEDDSVIVVADSSSGIPVLSCQTE